MTRCAMPETEHDSLRPVGGPARGATRIPAPASAGPCRVLPRAVLTLAMALAWVGGLAVVAPTAAARGSTVVVSITNGQFTPASVAIHPGDRVTFVNNDERDHSVVAADGSFNSGKISPGQSVTLPFPAKGAYAYNCGYHPRMKGTVTVQ